MKQWKVTPMTSMDFMKELKCLLACVHVVVLQGNGTLHQLTTKVHAQIACFNHFLIV